MSKKTQQTSFRYERKFYLPELKPFEVVQLIKVNSYFFKEIYYRRQINNIYFDTHRLQAYHDNVEGSSNRVKFRIRWYEDLLTTVKKANLEIKVRQGYLGKKFLFPVSSFNSKKVFPQKILFSKDAQFGRFKTMNKKVSLLEPSLINSYQRQYFQSVDGKYRLTVDSDVSFLDPRSVSMATLFHDPSSFVYTLPGSILEMKYDRKFDAEAEQVLRKMPFRLTKSSKYVMGVEFIHGWSRSEDYL